MIVKLREMLAGDGIAARAKRSSLLSIFGFAWSNAIRLASNLILTRLLFPEAFGLMALVQVVMAGVQMMSDVGLHASIVQHPRGDDPDFVNTAWTLKVIRGFVLSLAVFLIAPFAADFYNEPQLAELLPVAGLAALISGFMSTRVNTAGRHLRLGRVTVLSIFEQLAILAMTAFLAWQLESVWGLVIGNLFGGLFRNLTVRLFLPGEPNRFRLEREALRDLFGFGKFILISTIATFLVNNGDRAILGKYISIEDLGIYAIAMTFAALPITLVRKLDSIVIFPLYSRRPPHENAEHRARLFRARYPVTAMAFFGCLVMICFGEPIIGFLYDSRYQEAGLILVLVAIGFLPSIIIASYESILLANNRSDSYAVLVMINSALRISILFWGIANFGVVGAALAPAVSTLAYYPFLVALSQKYKAWDVRHDIVFFTIGAVITAVALWTYAPAIRTTISMVETTP